MLPLEGVTVVDFSFWFPGSYCSRLLNDMGAKVIKVERPESGDPLRNMAGTFNIINAGKKAIAVQLSTDEGRDIIYRLLRKADVVIEGFLPGTVDRLGIDYGTVCDIKKDIIYCSITGYGQTGPLAYQPAYNINVLAESGVLGIWGQKESLSANTSGVWMADLSASMFATITIIALLMQKERQSRGAYIDISMSDGCVSWLSGAWGMYQSGSGKSIEEMLGLPAYGIFEAKHGKCLALSAIDDNRWLALCDVLDFKDYLKDPLYFTLKGRRQRIIEINKRIAQKLISREREYWIDLLKEIGVAVNPVNTPEELAVHSHFIQRDLLDTADNNSPAEKVAFPPLVNRQRWGKNRPLAPKLGQDTQEILKTLGYNVREIKNLNEKRIVQI